MGLLYVFVSCLWLTSVMAQFGPQRKCYKGRYSSVEGTCMALAKNEPCPAGHVKYGNGIGTVNFFFCGWWGLTCCVREDPAPPTGPSIDESNCGLGGSSLPDFAGSQSRILKGVRPRNRKDYPFIVSLRASIPGATVLTQETTVPGCAGVLLDTQWVLTAAMCCFGHLSATLDEAQDLLLVVAGENDTSRGGESEQFIRVAKCIVHPDFAEVNTLLELGSSILFGAADGYGLALIKLAEPVQLNEYVQPVCLPFASSLEVKGCDTFEQCYIAGWGFDNANYSTPDAEFTLKIGDVDIYKGEACDFLQYNVFAKYPTPPIRFPKAVCQASPNGNDACLGDQGGGVMCYDGFRWTVQAIIPLNFCVAGQVKPYVIGVSEDDAPWMYATMRDNA